VISNGPRSHQQDSRSSTTPTLVSPHSLFDDPGLVMSSTILPPPDDNHSGSYNPTSRKHVTKKALNLNRHRRNTRTLGVIIAVCLLCWLPFFTLWPVMAYITVPFKLLEYAYWSAYLNSAINPLLYFLSNSDFRHAFCKLILRRTH